MLIVSLTFVSFAGAMKQFLKISSRYHETMSALSKYEELLFEIENGLRPDLAKYGGRGNLGEKFAYEIQSDEKEPYGFLKSKLSWREDKENFNVDFFVLQGALE